MSFRRSGSQQSNASNGSQIRVEMNKLEPMEAYHSKLKANFAGLRNQPSAAKFRSHFVRLRNSPECFQIFAIDSFWYFASDIWCLNPNSLLVIHQLDDSLVVKQEYRGKQPVIYCFVIFNLRTSGNFPQETIFCKILHLAKYIISFAFFFSLLFSIFLVAKHPWRMKSPRMRG